MLTRPAKNAFAHAASGPDRTGGTRTDTTGVVSRPGRAPPVGSRVVYDYPDVLAQPPRRRQVPELPADPGLVVETADGEFCGAVVEVGRAVDAGEKRDTVTLEDRHGKRRVFALLPAAFLVDGQPVTLVRPMAQAAAAGRPRKTASGSYAV